MWLGVLFETRGALRGDWLRDARERERDGPRTDPRSPPTPPSIKIVEVCEIISESRIILALPELTRCLRRGAR